MIKFVASLIACVIGSCGAAELIGYLLHKLLHSGRIPFLSMNHMKHHLTLYGPLQKMRPVGSYRDATSGQLALGNIGLEWLIPSGILLALFVAFFCAIRVPYLYQSIFVATVLIWSFLMFSYLHDRMHIHNFWMSRHPLFKNWFLWARRLHDIHHRALNNEGLMDRNFGIGFAFYDWVFGTLAATSRPFNRQGYEVAKKRFAFAIDPPDPSDSAIAPCPPCALCEASKLIPGSIPCKHFLGSSSDWRRHSP